MSRDSWYLTSVVGSSLLVGSSKIHSIESETGMSILSAPKKQVRERRTTGVPETKLWICHEAACYMFPWHALSVGLAKRVDT